MDDREYCECEHHYTDHDDTTGPCALVGCDCVEFRPSDFEPPNGLNDVEE